MKQSETVYLYTSIQYTFFHFFPLGRSSLAYVLQSIILLIRDQEE
jgi:hypothetical protein